MYSNSKENVAGTHVGLFKTIVFLGVGLLLGLSNSLRALEPPPTAVLDAAGGQAGPPPRQKLLHAEEIATHFAAGNEKMKVIVNLVTTGGLVERTDFDDVRSVTALRTESTHLQDELLARHDPQQTKTHSRLRNIAGVVMQVNFDELQALLDDPLVKSVEATFIVESTDVEGLNLINGASTRAAYGGAGISIAIVDSGVDYRHPQLGEAGFPNSKVIGGWDIADNDALPLMTTNSHGTACAGIAAGSISNVGSYNGGVAPAAKIYALKVTHNSGDTDNADILQAWDWCIDHRMDDPQNPIKVISTSMAIWRYPFYATSTCENFMPSLTDMAHAANQAGITVVVSSGNDGFCNAQSWPSCISSVISVGAVYDANIGGRGGCVDSRSCVADSDTNCETGASYEQPSTRADLVPGYSNTSNMLTVFAPADSAVTTDLVGDAGVVGDFRSFTGTSAACPYVAGAVAALQSAARSIRGTYLTPAEVRQILISTGNPVTDPKAGIAKPRINVGAAIASLSSGNSARPDLIVERILVEGEDDQFPRNPMPAQPFSIDVWVRNVGNAAAGPFKIGAYPHSSSEVTNCSPYLASVSGLGAGQSCTARFDVTAAVYTNPGDYRFWAWADPCASQVAESDEANNKLGHSIYVSTGPDLVVESITTDPRILTSLVPNEPVNCCVVVKNIGDHAPAGCWLTAFFDGAASADPCSGYSARQFVPMLAAGQTATISFEGISYASEGVHTFRAFVDGCALVAEGNESNNAASLAINIATPTEDPIRQFGEPPPQPGGCGVGASAPLTIAAGLLGFASMSRRRR